MQVYIFLAIAWFWDIRPPLTDYIAVLPALVLSRLMLGALGLVLSSFVRQLGNFAGVMNFVIFPMFFTSSALYPLWRVQQASLPIYWASEINPFTHAVELIRFALYDAFNPVSALVSCAYLALFLGAAIIGYDPGRWQHTMRYACEAPATMERRLGAFAKAIQLKIRGDVPPGPAVRKE